MRKQSTVGIDVHKLELGVQGSKSMLRLRIPLVVVQNLDPPKIIGIPLEVKFAGTIGTTSIT
jgi:hypothetical protein